MQLDTLYSCLHESLGVLIGFVEEGQSTTKPLKLNGTSHTLQLPEYVTIAADAQVPPII